MATDIVVDVTIDILKESIKSYLTSQYDYQFGIKSSLRKLDSNLTIMQAAMAKATRNGNEEQNFVRWLNEIKDAIYEAEDIVDTFQYKRLEQEAKRSPVLSNNQMPGWLRIVPCDFTDLLKVGIKFLKRLIYRDEDLNDLTSIVAKLDSIVTQIPNLLHIAEGPSNIRPNLVGNNDEVPEGRRETPNPVQPKLYGRDEEKRRLLTLLKDNLDEGEEVCYTTLCIVGIGGVGKTTLAQFVYDDASLKEYFSVKAWVSVSDNFTTERLIIEIMQSASINMPPNIREQGLIYIENCLIKGLGGKRFLIVLDDVWETMDFHKWENLQKLFGTSEKGSKILVTTRSQDVGRSVGAEEKIQLLPLQDDSFKELFLKCSFGKIDPKDHPSLEKIALQIMNELDGLPLAAKTIGAVLKYDMKESHWENILRSKAWAEKENRVMATLKLSYDHLPSYLKQCFSSCSLFRRNFGLVLIDLASYWTAHDFIQERNTQKQLLEVVREYVDELVARSFFSFTKGGYYVMHSLVHDLATSLSRDEIYRVKDEDSMNSIPETIRHLYVDYGNLEMVLEKIPPKIHSKLRSLAFWTSSEAKFITPATSLKLKSLRMLCIYGDYGEIDLESVNGLIHLRCFIIDGQLQSSTSRETICKLYQLKTLMIPSLQLKGLHKLFNLHTVIVGDVGKSRLEQLLLPKEFGSYVAIEDDGCRMSDIGNLNNIFGDLHLQIKSNVRIDEAREAKLVDKKHIKKLCFKIYGSDQLQEDVLEELRPNQHLQELQIVCPREGDFKAAKLPSWISNTNLCYLKHMVLVGCKYLETLPCLGELPHLQVLLLERLHSLKNIGDEFYGEGDILFPSLKLILVRGLENLEKWSAPSNKKEMFPNLLEVYIAECHKLQGPIPFPTPPKPFDIVVTEKEEEEDEEDEKEKEEEDRKEEGKEKDEEDEEEKEEKEMKQMLQPIKEDDYKWEPRLLFKVDDISLIITPHSENDPNVQYVEVLNWFNKSCSHWLCLSSLSSPKVLYIYFSNIQSMPLQSLPTSLKKLRLFCCAKLEDVDGLKDLTSLEELQICFCPNIKKLPEPCLPASMKLLTITNYDPDWANPPNRICTISFRPAWYNSCKVRYRVYEGGWYKPTLHRRWWRKEKWEEKLDWRNNHPQSEWHKISHIPRIIINKEDIPHPPLDDGMFSLQIHSHDGCMMSDFGNLKNIFGDLHLDIKSNLKIDEAREAKLVDKKHIKKLCFRIYVIDQLLEDFLEGRRPNQHLEELRIICPEGVFNAAKLPSWISNTNLCYLKHMVLIGCKYLETLPSLGELPHLQVLLLERLHSLKNIGNEFYGEGDILFPSLKMILVRGLENLEKWSAPSNKKEMFPNLLEVYIAECHKLQGPIPFPTPPKPFDIVITEKEEEEDEEDEKKKEEEDRKEEGKEKDEEEDEKGEEDEEEKEDEKGEKAKELLQQIEEDDYPWESRLLFKVEDISLIISPHSENYPDAQYVEELVWINKSCSHGLFLSSLSSLKELYLHFSNIQSMPLQSLPTSLKKLALLCCAKLEDVDGLKDLTSLEELVIHFCPNIKKLPEPCLPASIKLLEVINYDPDFATWPNGIYTRIYTPEWYKSFEVRYRVYNGGWYKPTLHPRWWRKGKWEEKLDWRKNDPESEWHKISHIPCIFINTEDIPYPPLDDGLT